MLFLHFLIGSLLICVTVVIHAVALDFMLGWMKNRTPSFQLMFQKYWKIPMLVCAVLGVFCAHIAQIWLWAVFYMLVGALPDFEEALYFSTTTFTTVGFGDVYLDQEWRLVSSFQSANGFILFGWSTAYIFEVMSKLYERDSGDAN